MHNSIKDYIVNGQVLLDRERANELTNEDIEIAFIDIINALAYLIEYNKITFTDNRMNYELILNKLK